MSEGEGLLRQEELDELFRAGAEGGAEVAGAALAGLDSGLQDRPGAASEPAAAKTSAKIPPGEVSDSNRPLKQAEIDRLLEQAGITPPRSRPTPPPPESHSPEVADESIAPRDLEYLLEQAERALRSVEEPSEMPPIPGLKPFQFEQFGPTPGGAEAATLDLVGEVELEVRIELGQARLYLEDVLKLRKGSVVTLDKLAGDPVDIYVNGRLIARGEVLVLNDNFCVRVAELVVPK